MRSYLLAIVCCLALTGFKTGQLGSVEIRYDFESVEIDSGPDTFELFEANSAEVSLSSQFAFRGGYALHLQDQSGNQDFPEFQGYFPTVSGGTLELGFAFMTPDPSEPFNIALAGDNHFKMTKDGLGFWLFNDAGTLRHVTNSIPKRLIELVAYQWYWVAAQIDVSSGVYSLSISDEYGDQLVALDQQANPTAAKRSNLRKYSFAGDLEDRGSANLYVDDFILRTDFADSPAPIIAPGRRALFIDQWNLYHKKIQNIDFCLAAKLPYDFIDIYNTDGLRVLQDNVASLRVLLDSPDAETLAEFTHESDVINGVHKWVTGCSKLKSGQIELAIEDLEIAQAALGYSPATQLALAVAYARTEQYYEAHAMVSAGQLAWPEDVRWLVLASAISFMLDQAGDAEMALSRVTQRLTIDPEEARTVMEGMGWLTSSAVSRIRKQQVWNDQVEGFILAEQFYFSLLWQDRYGEAQSFVDDFNRSLRRHKLASPLWQERGGDAALFDQRFAAAESQYRRAIDMQGGRVSALQKLADVYFLQGRAADERRVRESIYGALNYE